MLLVLGTMVLLAMMVVLLRECEYFIGSNMYDAEVEYWETKVPPKDQSHYEALSHCYSVQFLEQQNCETGGSSSNSNGTEKDISAKKEVLSPSHLVFSMGKKMEVSMMKFISDVHI